MSALKARILLLTNRIALILLLLSVVLAAAAYFTLSNSVTAPLILLTAVFYFGVLLLNRRGFFNLSRLGMSAFVPMATLAVAVIIKRNTPQVEEIQYFNSRIVLLLTAIIPLTLFLLREKKLLALGLAAPFLCLALYDPIHELFGVDFYQLGHSSAVYDFLDFLLLVLFALIAAAFLYYKMMLEKAELDLMSGNNQLRQLYQELGRRHEEIQAQAEKLVEGQQQLQEANQLIEQQKELLQAENTQLHAHLLEKNKILEASNQELHSRIEELRQFSYTISHNLRGPVASLLGLINIFDFDNATPHNRQLLLHAKTASQALDTVICDLSQVLQIREGKLDMEQIALPHLLENVLLSLKSEQEACAAEIRQELQVQEIQGVKSYLHSILYNLISNAIKYHKPGRPCSITIKSSSMMQGVLLEISDNGVGIDLERHGANLFKMYKRFHENREGRGLGLYLIKVQTEILGGYIEVRSQPDQGSTFLVWLPQQHPISPLASLASA
ncbi:sensor histidine kinase [Cesiribacter andamanensis]|nr:HAMP domain-containing sensor histidine kinase [Cesiribacter andamanensis]